MFDMKHTLESRKSFNYQTKNNDNLTEWCLVSLKNYQIQKQFQNEKPKKISLKTDEPNKVIVSRKSK